jgi:peptide/nickel transport system substrate-binding protein
MDALIERMRVEIDPAKRKTMVVEFQQCTTLEAVLPPLVEFDSITLASPAVRNHSNDPNFVAAGWGDLWLA